MTTIETYFADVSCLADEALYRRSLARVTPARQQKAQEFCFAKDRRLCVGAWLLLEHTLKVHDVALGAREIKYGPHEKPYLSGGPHFNLSHSGTRVLCAVCASDEVGCDVEAVKPFELKLAQACMQPAEVEEMLALPAELRARDFYRRWTLKESFMKAHGTGLTLAPETFAITLPHAPTQSQPHCSTDEACTFKKPLCSIDTNCTFEEFALDSTYAYAACVLASNARFDKPKEIDLAQLI